jgi:ferredoxin
VKLASGGFRVVADKSTCAVSSLCVSRLGAVFDQDDDGHVVVLIDTPPEELHDAVRAAVRGCPTRSIHVIEDPDPG